MPRPIWSGSISFGLVNVPVKLVTATSPKDVRFNQLHGPDGGRINQKRVCSLDGEEVEYSEIVKGYDVGGGHYVIVEPEELASLDPEATRTIDIEEFVDLEDIDPLFFEHSYYLVPDGKAAKPYALLAEAMAGTGKVALGRFVLRTKQYLSAMRAKDGVLVLSTMLYADEVVEAADLEVPTTAATRPSERELTMAKQLVESLAGTWDPAKYHDDYREKVMAMIEAKAEGQELPAPAETSKPAPVIDLMAALEASLARARGDGPAAPKGGAAEEGESEASSGTGKARGAAKAAKATKATKATKKSAADDQDHEDEEHAHRRRRASA
jgi:DNA end-binding protein Ku